MWDLRPLGAGELLDRAVTLFVRRFMPIVVVLAVVYVPISVVGWLILGPIMDQYGMFARHAQAPAALPPVYLLQIGGLFVVQVAALLLARTALVNVLAASYVGAAQPPGSPYAVAVRRWPAQLLAAAISGLVLLAIAVIVTVGFVALVAIAAALRLVAGPVVSVIVMIVLFIVLAAIASLCSAWVYMGAQVATVEIAGGMGGVAAFGYGLRVATEPRMRWRMLAAALVLGMMMFGLELIVTVAGALVQVLTHMLALQFAMGGVVGILFEGLTTAFLVVFAVDLKVRREGLDLDLATA